MEQGKTPALVADEQVEGRAGDACIDAQPAGHTLREMGFSRAKVAFKGNDRARARRPSQGRAAIPSFLRRRSAGHQNKASTRKDAGF